VIIGLPCFRFKIVGHYFALVTLALSEVTRLLIVALRDQTGGSLSDAFKQFPALDLAIYGLMLVLFIIYMPKGILGTVFEVWRKRSQAAPAAR